MRKFKTKGDFTFIPPHGKVSGILIGEHWAKWCPSLLIEIFDETESEPVIYMENGKMVNTEEIVYTPLPQDASENPPVIVQLLDIPVINADLYQKELVENKEITEENSAIINKEELPLGAGYYENESV